MSHGGQLAGAAQLPGNVQQGGGVLLRRKLVGDGPAGKLVRIAHGLPGGHIPHLDHRAVDEEIQTFPPFLNLVDQSGNFVVIGGVSVKIGRGKPIFPNEGHHALHVGIGRIFDGADLIEKRVQLPFGGNSGIQIPQGACRGVPGVFQRLVVGLVVFFQHAQAHDALALNFQKALPRNGQGHAADGSGLRQNGLAHHAVAPGGGLDQLAVIVGQVDGQAVQLVFHRVLQRRQRFFPAVGQLSVELLRAGDPVPQFFLALHLAHAPQAADVLMLLKIFQRLRAHPMGRRVGQHHARLFLHLKQLIVFLIPLRVAHGAVAAGVIENGRLIEFVHQSAHILLRHVSRPPSQWGRWTGRIPCCRRR